MPAKGETGSAAALLPHHQLAAQKLERLFARAMLGPRVTLSYDPARTGSSKGQRNGAGDISDSAAEARRQLNLLASALPQECWGVMVDVYALGLGLQQVETARRWPRRSAKLVLRIALEQLAARFGLQPVAEGRASGGMQGWLEQRLPLIAERD
jgi:hypothetical protein